MSDYNRYSNNNNWHSSTRDRDNRRPTMPLDGTGSSRRVSDAEAYRRAGATGSSNRVGATGSTRRVEESINRSNANRSENRGRYYRTSARGEHIPSLHTEDGRRRGRRAQSSGFDSRNSRYDDQYASRNNASRSSRTGNGSRAVKDGAGKAAGILGSALMKIGSFIGAGLIAVSKKSKIALVIIILVALFAIGGAIDSLASIGKVHGHVVVGDVKAKGMTKEELAQTLQKTYDQRLSAGDVTVYASEEAMKNEEENPIDSGELSVEEVAKQTVCWKADKDSLQVRIDYNALAEEAFEAGRGGIFDRLSLIFFKRKIPVELNYNETSLEALASNMDLTLGHSFSNSEITVENGKAKASKSKDGVMVDREELKKNLTKAFVDPDVKNRQFVEQAVETPAQINQEKGQAAADKINAAIANGAKFTYQGESWKVDKATLGSWVGTYVIQDDDGEYELSTYFDPKKAQSDISEHAKAVFPNGDETVSFKDKGKGNIVVILSGEGTMPQINSSISKLNDALFGNDANTSKAPTIEIESTAVPKEMPFNEALNAGVISLISEYTTEYTLGAEERNHNIQLAADLLNNSICKANGGEWSFHDTIGQECNEELGFQQAGSIVGGVLTDEIGGGICQTATTVFNAVYEAGLPITSRRNHSMYVSSYEPGRDAAVSWPDLDLVWENDTSSDILMKTGHTDTTVSVYLYGVDPGYTVETESGQWEEGREYSQVVVYDSELAPGTSYIKTSGSNGKSITVIRKVFDKSGEQIREDTFVSNYDPTDEVTVRGGTAADFADND